MSAPESQFLTTETLIFATSPAWLDFCSPMETIALRLTLTPPGDNLQKANCIIWAKAETPSWTDDYSLTYILISQYLPVLASILCQRHKSLLFSPTPLQALTHCISQMSSIVHWTFRCQKNAGSVPFP